jgi:hypothetical protein
MNMDLEEKIARAIYESRPRHPRAEWSTEPPAVRDGIRESARSVLSCLEENGMVVVPKIPTKAMQDAGYISNAVDGDGEGGCWLDGEAPIGIWQAMLAAAPKQG